MARCAPHGARLSGLSRRLSYVLRHDPGAAGVQLDPGGWVDVDALLEGLARTGRPVTRDELDSVVTSSSKQRFAYDATGRRIRAQQGHSVAVDLGLIPVAPPDRLFHGTVEPALDGIRREGISRGSRHHVHLSPDAETARAVGRRRGAPVVLVVDAAAMAAEGHTFFVSGNGVWLTDEVPPGCLSVLGDDLSTGR